MTTEKFKVLNRWSGAVQFTAEIIVAPDMTPAVKLGLAVKWAIKTHANLTGAYLAAAYLAGANLTDANLTDANLTDANLADAYLAGANLAGANLRAIKADLFMILAMGHKEVPALVSALRDGRVDGSTYSGDCACLVGTLENAGASGVPHAADSPAEQWFAPIGKGVKPGDDSEGGFRSAKALEWALEYCAATGIELPIYEEPAQ